MYHIQPAGSLGPIRQAAPEIHQAGVHGLGLIFYSAGLLCLGAGNHGMEVENAAGGDASASVVLLVSTHRGRGNYE